MSEANKHDTGKLRWDLLPPDAMEDVVKIFTDGAKVYGPYNWAQGMSWSRCFSAMMRHAWAYWRGEDIDPESGMNHMGHVVVNALFLLAYAKRGVGRDDRFTNIVKEEGWAKEKLLEALAAKDRKKRSESACASQCRTVTLSYSKPTRSSGMNHAGQSQGKTRTETQQSASCQCRNME